MIYSTLPAKARWNRALYFAFVPLLLSIIAGSGRATTLDFTYLLTAGGPALSGTMNGTLQADNNRFVVTSIGPVTFDGSPAPALPFVYSIDAYLALDTNLPTVTLDGSYMDFLACTPGANCPDGFGFAVGDAVSGLAGDIYDAGLSFGGANAYPYSAANWSASIEAVPEPNSLFLGLTVLALIPVGRRLRIRRRTKSA